MLRLEKHERPRLQRREQRVLNHDEIVRLLAHCLPRYQPLLITALYTGMRLSELLGLTWQDIDLERQVIHVRYQLSRPTREKAPWRVRLKTQAATRDIPLLPQLGSLLKRHKLAAHHSARTTSNDAASATPPTRPASTRTSSRGCGCTISATPSRPT